MKKENREWTKNEEEIGREVVGYYRKLFTGSSHSNSYELLRDVPETISRQMNDSLINPVEEKEIKEVIFSMNPNKSPGPDGMSPLFFPKILGFSLPGCGKCNF